jgi:hypothetical protein
MRYQTALRPDEPVSTCFIVARRGFAPGAVRRDGSGCLLGLGRPGAILESAWGVRSVLSDEERRQRRRLSRAKAKVKLFEARAKRAELRAAYWRRRVADLQFEQSAAFQAHLWPVDGGREASAAGPPSRAAARNAEVGERAPE